MFGLKISVLGSHTITQSTPEASQDLKIEPKFPGFSIDSIANKKGFFLMVEGSQIDWGGHAGNTIYIVEEMLDFDQTVGKVLEFAAENKETLVVVTADHETGGMAVLEGDLKTGRVKGEFTTGGHTGLMVPVFAWGPGASEFTGIMENTAIHSKIKQLLLGD